MSRRRPKPPLAKVLDFAAALKRREELQNAVSKREDITFLSFSLFESPVTASRGRVEIVIDRYEGLGLEMSPKMAKELAKALRAAARSATRKGAG